MGDSEKVLMERKDRLLAKLEQRNEERKATNDDSQRTDGAIVDDLLGEIKKDLDSEKVDSLKIDRLQEYLTFSLNNRQSKAIQQLLEDVRTFKLTQSSAPKFKGFSFSKSRTASSAPSKPPPPLESQSKPVEVNLCAPSESENVVESLSNEIRIFPGRNGEDINLKNIENCRLQFNSEPSIVHIRNVKNSTLIFLRCDRSLLIHDCDNVHIYVAAQQVRIHTSQNLHLHVATRGALILEDSTNVVLYPYRLKTKSGELIEAEDNLEWRTPRDFNWLATTPSPNWRLANEEDWRFEQLSD